MTDHTIYFDVLKQSVGPLFRAEYTGASKTAQLAECLASLIESHGSAAAFPAGSITPAASVFSRLNGHEGMLYFPGSPGSIPYPLKTKESIAPERLQSLEKLRDLLLQNSTDSLEDINRMLGVLEQEAEDVTVSTSGETADVTVYDHIKLCIAVAACLAAWQEEHGGTEQTIEEARKESLFILASMDISGIQKFIYTIASEGALRMLRSRSFYLDLLMEHTIDEMLTEMELPRACLAYAGGGHCYMLLPNTEKVKTCFERSMAQTNQWLLETFQSALFIGGAYEICSPDMLSDTPEGAYGQIYRNLSQKISEKKAARYTPEQILQLNRQDPVDDTRECMVCRRTGRLNDSGRCPFCESMARLSQNILYARYFTVMRGSGHHGAPLPGNCVLIADEAIEDAKNRRSLPGYVRCYGKQVDPIKETGIQTLNVADYTNGQSFEEMADQSQGIHRIGVLRADVDSLGHAFVAGFQSEKHKNRYVTLSRSVAFSRQMARFFKRYMNEIAANPLFALGERKDAFHTPNLTIVYSGGDDLFAVGAWNDIISFGVDIKNAFARYTDGTLTLSAGIGVYLPHYPVHAIANETGSMESRSKHLPDKNAVTLMEDGGYHLEKGIRISDGTFSWSDFEERVVGEKLNALNVFFASVQGRGASFMYKLLELLRDQSDKIYFARYIYLLSRMEPNDKAPVEEKQSYRQFMGNMVRWYQNERDCRELRMAMMIYAYLNRETEED